MFSGSRRRLKNAPAETALFQRRALVGLLLVAAGFGVLALRYAWLQVSQHQDFLTRSDQNRIKLRPVVPARGLIFDRNGQLLADNVPAYRLEVTPDQVTES